MIGKMAKIVKKKSQQVTSDIVKPAKVEDRKFSGSVKCLLFNHGETIEDKIATVKTAQLVDSGRFEVAFKTLMRR